MDDNALIQALLSQILPEWSISKQEYQPTDIANQTSATNILQDQFQLMAEPLMQILNGTFDYGLLDDVEAEQTAAPDTPMLNSYAGNPKYAAMIDALNNGESPEEAARGAWAVAEGREGDDVWGTTAAQNPSLGNYISVANSLQPEVAAVRSWQNTTDGMQKSEMAQTLESMGLSSEQTPDSYFSDSIDEQQAGHDAIKETARKALEQWQAHTGKVEYAGAVREAVGGGDGDGSEPDFGPDGRWNTVVPGQLGHVLNSLEPAGTVDNLKKAFGWLTSGPGDDRGVPGLPGEERDQLFGAIPDPAPTWASGALSTEHTGRAPSADQGPGGGGGDPRKRGTRNFEEADRSYRQRQQNDWRQSHALETIQALNAASSGRDGTWLEKSKINQARNSGRSVQRDALVRSLLSMPR